MGLPNVSQLGGSHLMQLTPFGFHIEANPSPSTLCQTVQTHIESNSISIFMDSISSYQTEHNCISVNYLCFSLTHKYALSFPPCLGVYSWSKCGYLRELSRLLHHYQFIFSFLWDSGHSIENLGLPFVLQ